ncbi:MAG TPA: hypothetical protein VFP49_01310 [Nitrososphaeraceae archaeon]|nr:hypothetical protein [Nitrososphaeraceae archaeon]
MSRSKNTGTLLLRRGLLLSRAYKTATVHPCDGFIPCNKPKMIIPDKTDIFLAIMNMDNNNFQLLNPFEENKIC